MRAHTDQQRMLADAARQFAQKCCVPNRIRGCRDRTPDHDPDIWRQMADLGWLSLLVPEADGGLGGGLSEMGQLVYEWGAACGPEPLIAAGVFATALVVSGDGPARAELLTRIMEANTLPAVAWLEDGAQCTRVVDGWQLTGRSRYVTPAHADGFLLVAIAEASESVPVLYVPASATGVTVTIEPRADGTAAALVALENVRLPIGSVVVGASNAVASAEAARNMALVMAAVSMAGTMRTVNSMTQEYLRTRVQFGKSIGAFQALQHKAVDMHIAEQLARDVAQSACAGIDAGGSPDAMACLASRAKARAGDSLDRIVRLAVQLHGAIGYTDEYDLSLHLKRALTMSSWLGNSEAHLRRYARHAPPFEAVNA